MNLTSLLIALTVILLGALAGGRLAAFCRIPRVTGYLLTGLFAGPSLAHLLGLPTLLSQENLTQLRIVTDLALALILINIGGLFEFSHLRRWRHRIVLFSASEIFLTFLLVAATTLTLNLWLLQKVLPGLSLWQSSLNFALFLGVIAVATAPAATLMVIREYEADGPVTSTVLTLVGINNLTAVLGFAVVSHFLIFPGESLWVLLLNTLGPLCVGGLLGLALAVWGQRLELPSEYKLLLIGGAAAGIGVSRLLDFDPLLTSLALGIALANSSPCWAQMSQALRQVDYLLYVIFFVIAGANLHIETLGHIGLLGVGYVLARACGKLLGARIGAKIGAFGERERNYVGLTLLAQAGVAIGLAASLARNWPEGGQLLQSVVLGSVVVFELIGPLAVRHGLVRAGEVPILSLLQKRAPQGALEGLHTVASHFRSALGLSASHQLKDPGDLLVRHVMRRNVESVRNNTPYNELLRFIAHSRYDRFPVVNREGAFLGMINYTEIRNLLFEPSLVPLVVAGDLVSGPSHAVHPEQSLREVIDILEKHKDISYFPVIDPTLSDRLVGILSQNDLFAAFRRIEKG